MSCPTPSKDAHTTRAEAVTHAAGRVCRTGMPTFLRVYQCACGAWHLTHTRKVQL